MGRWLLNHLATWQLAFLIVGGAIVVTSVMHRLLRRRLSEIGTEANRELAGKLLGVLMAMFGFLLAFLIVSMHQRFQAADLNVQREAVQLSNMYRDSRVFDPATADAMVAAIRDYVDTILGEEQEAMANGGMSPDSTENLVRLFEVLQSYTPETPAQQTFYGQAVSAVNELNLTRRIRRNDVGAALPGAFLFLIWGGAAVLIAFLSLFSTNESWTQTVMVTVVGAFVGMNLFLLTTLNHPFSGDVAVSLQPFNEGSLGQIRAGTAP